MTESPNYKNETVFIELSSDATAQGAVVESLNALSSSLKHFIKALLKLANDDRMRKGEQNTYLVGRAQVQEYLIENDFGASNALVSRRLKELKDLGCASMDKEVQGGKRVNRYFINDFYLLKDKFSTPEPTEPQSPKRRLTSEIVHAQRDLFEADPQNIHLSGHDKIIFWNDQLFNGILNACMRLSAKDARKTISVTYTIAGHKLGITATALDEPGSEILTLPDLRLMRIIRAYCKRMIVNHKARLKDTYGDDFDPSKIPNNFSVDIHELCSLMKISTGAENLDMVAGIMKRLAETTFKINASENPWFKQTFSMMMRYDETGTNKIESDVYQIRFLNDFEYADDKKIVSDMFGINPEEVRPRFYSFSLDKRVFYALLSDTYSFRSHPELSYDRSGIVQRFYDWARAFISGRSKSGTESKWYSLREMHQFLTPAARIDNFRTYFLNALEKNAVDDIPWDRNTSGTALVHGYYVNYKKENNVQLFNIQRDRNDPIVGDNSRHNQLLNQASYELAEGTYEGV